MFPYFKGGTRDQAVQEQDVKRVTGPKMEECKVT